MQELLVYGHFWKEYGLTREDVNELDPKVVRKVLLTRKIENDLKPANGG
jgi:hypothetical protein